MVTTKTPKAGARTRTATQTGRPEREAVLAHPHGRRAADRVSERNRIHVALPMIGSVTVPSRDQLAFIGGMGLLATFGVLDWPVAAVIGAGHLLAANRRDRAIHDFGEALEEA